MSERKTFRDAVKLFKEHYQRNEPVYVPGKPLPTIKEGGAKAQAKKRPAAKKPAAKKPAAKKPAKKRTTPRRRPPCTERS